MIKTDTWAPKEVLVQGFPISVKIHPTLKLDDRDLWGSFVSNDQRVNLVAEYPTLIFGVSILLHELFHAMYWVKGLKNREAEEDVCINSATFLVALFKDCLLYTSDAADE